MIDRHNPRTNAAWHRLRGQDVTASVAGALFGLHPWVSMFQLWALKSGKLLADPEEGPAMRRGRLLEPVAVQILREDYPSWQITHNTGRETIYYRDAAKRIGGTPDVLAVDPARGPGVIQIKSVEASTYRKKWLDEDGNPEAPFWIVLQAVTEAYLHSAKWAAVAPLTVGHGLELPLIPVPLDNMAGIIARIEEAAADFWRMVETGEEPPVDYSRDADAIERMFARDQGEEIDLSRDNALPGLIEARHKLKLALKDNTAALTAIDAEIRHKMQGATIAHIAGGRKITNRQQRRAAFAAPATTFRALRVPPPE